MLNNSSSLTNKSESSHFDIHDNTHPENIVIIYCALNAPLMIMTVVGNALVIAAILGTPSLSSPSTTLLCNLAFTDLLVGLVAQPLFITAELKLDHSLTWLSFDITSYSFCGVSLWTMTAISIDRFAALHYHMRYVSIVTTSRVLYALVAMWLIIFSVSSALYLWNIFIHLIVSSVFIVVCLLISLFCYIRIFQIIQRHQMQIHAQQQAVQNSEASNSLNITQLKKSAMNVFIYYSFLLLCYIPTSICLAVLAGKASMHWPKEWHFTTTLVFVNSSINPLLYCWRLSELRRAVVKTARKMLCAKTD